LVEIFENKLKQLLSAMATLPNQESRSPHPKSQYATTTRAHVTVDLTAGKNTHK